MEGGSIGGGRRPFFKLLRSKARTAFVYFVIGTGAAAVGLHYSKSDVLPFTSQKIIAGVDGAIRSTRALYTIGFVVVDYKYSLRRMDPNFDLRKYRNKLAEVHLRSAKRILKMCEMNQGFYVKAGQFVSSMRQVPKEYSAVLSSLQDRAAPYNFKAIKQVLIENLRQDVSQIFLSFEEEPIAAASIAQVHRAVLQDNNEVAIKVQYPGLEQRMKIDITTMSILSILVSWIFPDYRFERLVSEFERTISLELDFVQEAKNSERTARNFKGNNTVKVPEIFWDLTTSRVLTMQFCKGHRVDDLDFFKQAGINPAKIAEALMNLFAEMIFVHGFLHGDPHPGNILVCPRSHKEFCIVILDHGIYKELDEKFRLDFCELWKALILLNPQKIHQLGEKFGVGKYSKYFPVIFTGRTIDSKSALGTEMSTEENRVLKQELRSLNMGDISAFMESLPPDFLAVLRTDGLLRSVVSKLGVPRRIRLLAYAKYAAYGLATEPKMDAGSKFGFDLSIIRRSASYFQLRALIEILNLLFKFEELGRSLVHEIRWTLIDLAHYIWSLVGIKL